VSTTAITINKIIKKNNKIKILEKMSETIFTAANVYVETNGEIKDELYKNKNGLKIPLTTLENSGLVDFEGVELTEDDYIVTMLGATDASSDHCAETYTAKSWNISDEVIYICEKKDGNTNLVTVAGDADNLSKGTRETYYFKGGNPKNFIQLNGTGTKYRIISIEKDDSLILYSSTSFGTTFNGKTMDFSYTSTDSTTQDHDDIICENSNLTIMKMDILTSTNEQYVDAIDLQNTITCQNDTIITDSGDNYSYIKGLSWLGSLIMNPAASDDLGWGFEIKFMTYSLHTPNAYKIHLKPCMEITGGTGDFATPYKLKNNCS